VLFVLALLAFFAIALPDAMLGVAWPFMRISFDQPLEALTLVLPFGVAATLLSTSTWTWAAARLGLGRLLTGSVALSAAALLCCALAPAYGVVVASAVLFGLSAGSVEAALNAYAARTFGPRRINLMHAAYGLGAATSPLIVTVVVSSGHGWRWAYAIVLVLQSGLTALFAASARRWAPVPMARTSDPAPRPRWRPSARAVAGLALAAVGAGLESVIGLWAFVYLLQAVALPAPVAGAVVSGYWAALVAGRVVLGAAAERFGTWPVLAPATVVVAGSAALIASGRPIAAAGVVLLGVAVAPIYPLLVLTTGERTDAGAVDRLVGYQAAASTVGSVGFGAAAGFVLAGDVGRFGAGVVVLAVLTGGGLWAMRPGQAAR
jgi:MFS family permease